LKAGCWYRLQMRALQAAGAAASCTVAHVGVGEVFVVAGQSNAANHGSEKQQSKTGLVASFDGKGWAPSNDPQPGASGGGGSFMPPFADAIVDRFRVPVGLVPIAMGSTSVREWLPAGIKFAQQTTTGRGVQPTSDGQWESTGRNFEVLVQRLNAFGKNGIRAVLRHQGESDAGQARSGYPAERQISGTQYLDFLRTLVKASQQASGWEVPWFSAQTTYHSENDPSDEEFRAAMRQAWLQGITHEGPDSDALRAEFRAGVHFNGSGLRKHGDLWAGKVGDWIAPERK